jgi:hypothetical protein
MKIAGVDPKSLMNEIILVLPRGETQIVFRARGLKDMDEFIALCPQPKAPGKLTKDGFVPHTNDPTYQQVMVQWGKKRLGYLAVKSLEPSEIEWETVKVSDPSTWENWERELLDSGLSRFEVNRVFTLVMEANTLDDDKLEKARAVFLAGQEVASKRSGLLTEPANT